MSRVARAARALPRLVVYLAWTLMLMPLQVVALALGSRLAERIPLAYHRSVCCIIGLRVERRGATSSARPTLFVCNHTSYLDITALGSLIPGSFVAKREVAGWPLFGTLAKLQRSVFIERHRRRTGEHRDEMAGRLAAGDTLILFPEGTSDDGNRVLPFRSGLFAAAEQRLDGAPVTVQPVSIAYSGLGGFPMLRAMRPFFAWYGDMELTSHLWTMLGRGPVTVVVEFHPPVTIDRFGTRKALAAHCHAVITAGVSAAIHGTAPRPARRSA
ncbi:MAG: lysophospholipid acyltransferase family protein [Alphaproteobacteria bacterium]